MSRPLDGVKILDLTKYIAGSVCTLFLSDYGAEVIKVESPQTQCDTVTEEAECARASYDRGKSSVIIDMNDSKDRSVFWELCKDADAVIENFRPGTMEGWGITYDTLRKVNPAIVYTSVSGYGQDGPYADREASDAAIQAESGIMSITGPRGRDSVKCGASISSYMAAMTGCIGTLTGLIGARRTGKGRRVDVSMLDTSILCLENQLAVYLRDGKVPRPMGNSYDLFAPVGLYQSRDGKEFMLSVGTDRQWVILCQALDKPEWIDDPKYVTNMRRVENIEELNEKLCREFARYDRDALAQRFQTSHCVYGNINDFQAVAEHPQIRERKMIVRAVDPDGKSYLDPGSPIQMSGMDRQMEYKVCPPGQGAARWAEKTVTVEAVEADEEDRVRQPEEAGEKAFKSGPADMPLAGIRILDFSQFLSGPLCTLLLSDFGAEVIKIENPPLGDNTRYGPFIEKEVSSHYAMRNRGKKSIVLNMKNEEHKALFLKLAKYADVVVDNYKPGTMEKFGVTYELLKEINPRIVSASISGYGQSGPYASHAAFDQPVQAESGVMSITGEAGGSPVKCGASIGDVTGGLAACIGILMAVYDSMRTGRGRRIDVAMMDSLVFGLGNQLSAYLRTGIIPHPMGSRTEGAAPSGAYRCRDGERIMSGVYTDSQWKDFCEAVERPDWLEKSGWASAARRAADADQLDREIGRIFALHTSEELAEMLKRKGCVFGRVNDFSDVKNHPQTEYRHTFVKAEFPNGVIFKVPGCPIRISGMDRPDKYPAAPLGYHTFEVLREVADDEELHRLFDPVLDEVKKAEKKVYDNSSREEKKNGFKS